MKVFDCNNLYVVLGTSFFLAVASVLNAGEKSRILTEQRSSDGRIEASLDVFPTSPRLSDKIELNLTVRFDADLDITMPEFGNEIGELTIIDSKESGQIEHSGTKIKKLKIIAVPRDSGTTPIWPISIAYHDKRNSQKEGDKILELSACEIEIASKIRAENASLDGIPSAKTIFDLQPGTGRLWALLLLLCAMILLVLAKKLKKTKAEAGTEKILSVQEIAVKRLADLHESRLYETDVKRFYVELTGIIRWYIEQQTKIRAPELTTQEFLREISDQWKNRLTASPEIRDRLRLFLESADMVKFARMNPSHEDINQAFQRAVEFVQGFLMPQTTKHNNLDRQTTRG